MKSQWLSMNCWLLVWVIVMPILGLKAYAVMPSDVEKLVASVKTHHGTFDPEIRTQFLRYAENCVIHELADVQVKLTEAQMAWIHQDQLLDSACFGVVFPPDPRIALNLLELRQQLGDEMFMKYKNLLIAGAVTRRYVGVGAQVFGEKEEWALRSKIELESKTGVRRWPDYTVVKIVNSSSLNPPLVIEKKQPRKSVVKKRQEKQQNHQQKHTTADGIDQIFDFLNKKQITPAQLMASQALRNELLAKMGQSAPQSQTITPELLMDMMTQKGLRPAERDPFPSMADFCRYLDGIKPRFPVTTAPWPVLMPLAKGWPLREAKDLWAKYADATKLPTYGKYQNKQLVIAKQLEPFSWHWQSWQGTYQAGGVCHEMSSIGLGTLICFGVPACKAGQPHHSCVLAFSHSDKGYYVGTKQGIKGPTQTHSQWLFGEPKVELPQPYHTGLALSMNVGLVPYLDSRIAVHLSEMLIQQHEYVLAKKLLMSAATMNPFNTEVWGKLAMMGKFEHHPMLFKAEMIHFLDSLVSSSPDEIMIDVDQPAEVSLEQVKDPDEANPKKWTSSYARTIANMMLIPDLKPTDDEAINVKIRSLLQQSSGSGIQVADVMKLFDQSHNPASSLK